MIANVKEINNNNNNNNNNGGQILKEFLIDNHVDIGKFKLFTSKRCASEDCTESENNAEFTRIRRKKFRLEFINYPISDSRWNNQVKSALFFGNHLSLVTLKKSYISLCEFIYSIFPVLE